MIKKRFSLRVSIMEKGFTISDGINGQIIGNVTGFIKNELYNKEAREFLKSKGFKQVTFNGSRTEWINEAEIKVGQYIPSQGLVTGVIK